MTPPSAWSQRSKATTAPTCGFSSSTRRLAAGATDTRSCAAHADARRRGHASITTGADAPFFLWPGVPSTDTALLCLLERHHYTRVETNFDMTIDLATITDDPGGHAPATPADRDEIATFMAKHWPNWKAEVLRALDKGNLVLAR